MTQDQHKHAEGHQVAVKVSYELLEKFNTEARAAAHKRYGFFSFLKKRGFVAGYVTAKIAEYRLNNGVPPIPFPVSFSTVDMAPWCEHEGDIKLLLGRKPGQTQFQFAGGFRDPKETNAEAAARELNEEMSLNLDVKRFFQVGQKWIDDIRYRNSCHKVTTTLFNIHTTYEELLSAKPADDLAEVKIFSIRELIKDNTPIRDIHRVLFEMLRVHIGIEPLRTKEEPNEITN